MNKRNRQIIVIMIVSLFLGVCLGCAFWRNPDPITKGELKQLYNINSNMEFIGHLLGSGKLYCVDNIGVDFIYENYTQWVSIKEMCEMIG